MINESTAIKYLDLVLVNIDDISSFNSYRVLNNLPELGKEKKPVNTLEWILALHSRVEGLGLTFGYFKKRDGFSLEQPLYLTKKGIKARVCGGHIALEKIKSDKNIQIEKREIIDFKLSKWKLKTFWWFFGFGIIGFVLSVYNFVNDKSPLKQLPQKEQQLEQIESELEKLHNEILIQKNLDSLHNSKVLNGNERIVEPQGN